MYPYYNINEKITKMARKYKIVKMQASINKIENKTKNC